MATVRSVRLSRSPFARCRLTPVTTARLGLQSSDRIRKRHQSASSESQKQSRTLDGYYDDIIKSPTASPKTRAPPTPPAPDELPKTDEEEKLRRALIVFGSRLAGPAQRRRELDKESTRIAGVMVPPRPEEPDNCCMSGCVNCVWDRYRDEIEDWASKSAQAREALQAQRSKQASERRGDGTVDALGRRETGRSAMPTHVASSMDDDGGGSETNWEQDLELSGAQGDIFAGVPVGIREFMRTEKRLKEQRRREGITS